LRLPTAAGRNLRVALGTGILALQALGIARARLVESRYFAWAPYDRLTVYEITVVRDGRPLDTVEVRRRYRLDSVGRDNRSPQHLIDMLRQYESTYGKGEGATVTLEYTVNGSSRQTWQWTDP
jgi:hypothetical protein